ncbi:winged helix-turn-helix domain-containing protein [Streptomyces liangshanensis]|uniref:Helix-turn-helix transcriptional regulator n=1 Tax=Streptomyces liangshanensis TaxID=2717324 RepID=A0A6G9H458_9ACTN|nr:helix-turn-helix domain-containing protein [Streptomyces liangshanensis]QIQ05244.1 helix-turn-helix transcriptional regulator [Streptomyces liangshanensis]
MTRRETRGVTGPEAFKVFGHPLRMRLYRALHLSRTGTASQLAYQVGETVSLVSYHLRKLADHGLIDEAEGQGDGRERWWKLASEYPAPRAEDLGDTPENAAPQAALGALSFAQRADLYLGYVGTRLTWQADWRAASFSHEYLALLTAAQLAELSREMHDLVRKYESAGRAAEEAGDTEGRERVALHTYGFPFRL